MNESDLIERARTGDAQATRALYQQHSGRVYAVIRRLAGDDSLAEDWAQEAWVRVFRALPSFRGDSQFSTWLHRIAVNSALHGRRTRDRRAGREEPLPSIVPSTSTGNQTLLRIRLEKALERLPERMRQVLVLHDVEGFTHEDIGERLGITAGTSKSQLFKARAHMRRLLRPAAELVHGEEACLI
jgi:RNA polymerase sigma-70 factor, ECF subfamily